MTVDLFQLLMQRTLFMGMTQLVVGTVVAERVFFYFTDTQKFSLEETSIMNNKD